MAVFTPTLETYGWDIEEIVAVQEPTFSVDVSLDFGTFDWFDKDGATLLTNAVIERGLASGWDLVESNVTIPSKDSSDASLAATFANLQTLFTDLLFGDCIDADYNNTTAYVGGNAVGYLTWSTVAIGEELTDEEWFESFCIKAGLTDGGGSYGFRYINSEGVVIYPNSTRKVTAGDLIATGTDKDIYLEDLLKALERIQFVGWEKPGDTSRHGRTFTWGALNSLEGNGDSESYHDPSEGWGGDEAVEFGQAKTEFSEGAGSLTEPSALAESKGELVINADSSNYTATVESNLGWSSVNFETPIEGDWDINIRTGTPLSANYFSPLGSALAEGWSVTDSGTSSDDEAVETDVIGATSMDTDLFIQTGVPSFDITVEITPGSSSGPQFYDWFVSATAKVGGGIPDDEDIIGNNNGSGNWTGDLEEGGLVSDGESLNLGVGDYSGTFTYSIFTGSPNADGDNDSASATVSATTTTTTTTTSATEDPVTTTSF